MWKPRRIYVVADLHGHYEELMLLFDTLITEGPLDIVQDQLVFLGDYIDFGPDSQRVVQQLIDWQGQYNKPDQLHIIALFGNHESLLLDALNPLHPLYGNPDIWFTQGGDETLKSYVPKLTKLSKKAFIKARANAKEFLDPEHVRWLSQLPYFYIDADYVFVHGGLPAQPLEQIVTRAQADDPQLFYDLMWLRDEFIYSSFQWGKRVIFGHTPTPNGEPIVMANKIGLNTLPRHTGKLTALEIPSMRFFYQPKL